MILTISGNRDITDFGKSLILKKTEEILSSYKFEKIYIGGARGVDTFALQSLLDLNFLDRPEIIVVVPFKLEDQPYETRKISLKADKLIELNQNKIINGWYNKTAYQNRNIYMIEKSTHLIAFTANSSGGTQNAIDFAQKIKIDVEIVNLK